MLPEPDTVFFPSQNNPRVVLSVTDEGYGLPENLTAPLDVYMETLNMKNDSSVTKNEDRVQPFHLGVFTNRLRVATTPDGQPIRLSVRGADVEKRDATGRVPKGGAGGDIQVLVENLNAANARAIHADGKSYCRRMRCTLCWI
jgi:hypothetical protein